MKENILDNFNIVLFLDGKGVRATKYNIELMKRFLNLVKEGKALHVNNTYCVPLYDEDGNLYLYRNERKAYQTYAMEMVLRFIKKGVFIIEQLVNPETKGIQEYLCLNLTPMGPKIRLYRL